MPKSEDLDSLIFQGTGGYLNMAKLSKHIQLRLYAEETSPEIEMLRPLRILTPWIYVRASFVCGLLRELKILFHMT